MNKPYQEETQRIQHKCKTMEKECVAPYEMVCESLAHVYPFEFFNETSIRVSIEAFEQSLLFGIRKLRSCQAGFFIWADIGLTNFALCDQVGTIKYATRETATVKMPSRMKILQRQRQSAGGQTKRKRGLRTIPSLCDRQFRPFFQWRKQGYLK